MFVLITGKAESGKDTIGDYLRREYNFRTDALAAPIKRLVEDVFVLPHEVVYDRELRERPLPQPWDRWTVRSLLQRIGTEMFREHISPDIWVLSLLERTKRELSANWAVTDVRFPNEQSIIQERYPGLVVSIKVVRPGRDGSTKGGIAGHASESFDLTADYVVTNEGSFDDLYSQIDMIMAQNGLCKVSPEVSTDACV